MGIQAYCVVQANVLLMVPSGSHAKVGQSGANSCCCVWTLYLVLMGLIQPWEVWYDVVVQNGVGDEQVEDVDVSIVAFCIKRAVTECFWTELVEQTQLP